MKQHIIIANVVDILKKNFLKKYGNDFGIFIKHGSKFVLAHFFAAAVSFIAIPIYTRLLTPSDYGILAVFNAALGIFSIIYGLQMYGSVSRYYLEKTDDFPDFLGTNLITLVVIIVVEGVIFWLLRVPIMKFFAVPISLFPLLIVTSIVSFGFAIYGNLLVVRRRSTEYTLIRALQALFLFFVSVFLIYNMKSDKYLGSIYARFLVTLIVFVYSLYKLLHMAKPHFNIKYLKYSANYNLPAIPGALSGFMLTFFDRIIINQLTTTRDTGLYSLAYNIGIALHLVYTGLFSAWVPTFFEDMMNKRHDKIRLITSRFADIIFFIALLMALFSGEIITIMASARYHSAFQLIPIIVLGYSFLFIADIYSNFASYRKEKIIVNSINLLLVCGLNIGLNYLLIPRFGYSAAAVTTTVSYFVLMILNCLNVRYLLKESILPLWMFLSRVIFTLMFFLLLSGAIIFIKVYIISLMLKIIALLIWGYFVFIRQIFLRNDLLRT